VACGIAAALAGRGLSVGVFKPAETGCRGSAGVRSPEDAARLRFFSDCRLDLKTLCPYALRAPLAPLVSAQREGVRIDLKHLHHCHDLIAAEHDVTLVEGAGGLLVPLTRTSTFADLAARMGWPLLVVIGSRLGAINHALLTTRYASLVGLRVLGYVVNFPRARIDLAARTNLSVFSDYLGPALGVVPYLGKIGATVAGRRRLAKLFNARLRLDDVLVPR
jgi:dethiobiotin synthetase